MIPEELKLRIRNSVDIVEVIGDKLTLRRAGKNLVGVCPFHDDKSPSFYVSPVKQTCKCFACGAGGDVFEFLQKHEMLTFSEAVKWCANRVGIEYEDREASPEDVRRSKEREALQITIEAATNHFQQNLPLAKEYLAQRGYELTDQILKDFRVGYAPEGNGTTKDLPKAGYTIENLIKIDVSKDGEHGAYDTFRDRVLFPFLDLNGRPIGFSGRMVKAKKDTGKYINTGDTALFSKSRAIFGLFQARAEISRKDNAYLVEGQFDVMTFHREGIINTIAGSGTALAQEQIKLISRFTRNVTTVYDCDKAGIKASLKNCKELLHAGMSVRCIGLPEGQDPDNLATELGEKTEAWLITHTTDFVTYFSNILNTHPDDPVASKEAYTTIAELVAEVSDESQRNQYAKILSSLFNESDDLTIARKKIREIRRRFPKTVDVMKPGIYGLDQIKATLPDNGTVCITNDFEQFMADYSELPTVYIHGHAELYQIQELRNLAAAFSVINEKVEKQITDEKSEIVPINEQLQVNDGRESDYMRSLVDCYRNGITELRVTDLVNYLSGDTKSIEHTFLNFYLTQYQKVIEKDAVNRSTYIERCFDIISFASDTERAVNSKHYADLLGLTAGQYKEILAPFINKRKSRLAFNAQRPDNILSIIDPNVKPDYVDENKEYSEMYDNYGYFPLINGEGKPVAYMFKNDKGGHTRVADFYMVPLLHIEDDDPEQNRRIFQINRAYYQNPFYMEFKSKSLLKRSTMEEVIIMREAMNFDNGTDNHWTHIKSCMSRKYTTCRPISIYGQQTENFYAFSNAIYHDNDGIPEVVQVDELGVASHNGKNYYLPAFSKIYSEARKDDDKFEALRNFRYVDLPQEKQCSFKQWAQLMNQVYHINDNGKWALIYAIMCAFRSDIHSIDRFFTAIFFMGPTQSGKTQIAVSIRSLYIFPEMGLFNLCTGSDAAFSTLMGGFRDVPVVLEEYNNKDISDIKFQGLKSITYDGDGRQKRKGTSGKEIETDKIYAPVIIAGQETPQRDDNALMNRIIVCEVPRMGAFTEDERALFSKLKDYEKQGLSNVLFEVLKLRPLIRKHFYAMKREISKELSAVVLVNEANASGDMVRIVNTVTLFLTTLKIITEHAKHLEFPFTYDEFFQLAVKKVISQVELISHSDKLSTFFKAMGVMLYTKTIIPGRDFSIEEPAKLTIKLPGNEKKELVMPAGTKVLFLRVSNIHTHFARSTYNTENATQTTIDQNLRSSPAYIGAINSRRFRWREVNQVPAGEVSKREKDDTTPVNMTMIQVMKEQVEMASCIALDYTTFRNLYDLDLERTDSEDNTESITQDLPF
jgi:DNA primase catalytic core